MPSSKPENESTATVAEVRIIEAANPLHRHLAHEQLNVLLALINHHSKED